MAGKPRLTPEQLEERRLEKEKLFEGRKKYSPRKGKNEQTETNQTTEASMENNGTDNTNQPVDNSANTNESTTNTGENNNAGTTNITNTEPIVTETKTDVKANPTYQPAKKWSPLGGDKVQRDYSTPTIDQNLLNTEIPEINIGAGVSGPNTQNNADLLNKPITDTAVATNAAKTGPEPIKPIVENWNQLSPDEQKNAAAQTTDMVLDVYDKLHFFGRMYIKKDHDDLIEAHNDEKIDMYSVVTENEEDPDKEITVEEFWGDFNNQVEERFIVSQGFKDAVRPPMERLCMKYGLGASDGLFVAYQFGKDAATKIAMLVGFKKQIAKMDEVFEKRHKKFKAEVQAEVDRRMAAQAAKDAKNNPKTTTTTTTVTPKEETTTTPDAETKKDITITEENKNEIKP